MISAALRRNINPDFTAGSRGCEVFMKNFPTKILACAAIALVLPATGYAHKCSVHPLITNRAVELAVKYLNSNSRKSEAGELKRHNCKFDIANAGLRSLYTCGDGFERGKAYNCIVLASAMEDVSLNVKHHFYNPATDSGLMGFKSAPEYAGEIFRQAVSDYKKGRKQDAFYNLGRVAHLFGDMGSPPHIFLKMHTDDLLEAWWDDHRGSLMAQLRSAAFKPVAGVEPAMKRLADYSYKRMRIDKKSFAAMFPNPEREIGTSPRQLDKAENYSGEKGVYYYVGNENAVPLKYPLRNGVTGAITGLIDNKCRFNLTEVWGGIPPKSKCTDPRIDIIALTTGDIAGLLVHFFDAVKQR